MTYLNSKIIIFICCLISTGCCTPDTRRLTSFPPMGKTVEYTRDPVISYDQYTDTYKITKQLMHNVVQYKIYIDQVNNWKTKNGVE